METNDTDYGDHCQKDIEIAILVVYFFIFVLGTVFNTIAIGVILFHRRLRQNPFNLLIVNLISIDFISCFVTVPTAWMYVYLYDDICSTSSVYEPRRICRVTGFLLNFSGISSLTIMCEIALLRVKCLLKKDNTKMSYQVIIIVILTNTMVIPIISFLKTSCTKTSFCRTMNAPKKPWIWINITIVFFFGLIICSSYAWIAWYAKKQTKRIAREGRGRVHGDRNDIATIKTCLVTVTFFLVCHIGLFIHVFIAMYSHHVITGQHYKLVIAFLMVTHVGNPVILLCTSKAFRKAALTLFTCKLGKGRGVIT